MSLVQTKRVNRRAMTEDEFIHLPKDGLKRELVGGETRKAFQLSGDTQFRETGRMPISVISSCTDLPRRAESSRRH